MKLKKVVSIILAIALILTSMSISTFADKPSIYLGDVTVYSVVKDETKIVVPVFASAPIDMQCYDITVTYPNASLAVVEDETKINLPDGEYTYSTTNVGTTGQIRFAGMTTEESAKAVSGQIGTITFTSPKRITKDGVEVELGFAVAELGFGTEVADTDVKATAKVILNKSENTNPTDTPVPSEITATLGDVDADGNVTASDALLILQGAAKLKTLTDAQKAAADVNKDTIIDAQDALKVLQKAANIIDKF